MVLTVTPTRYDVNLLITFHLQGLRMILNVKTVVLILWEEFVKVRDIEMGQNGMENSNSRLPVELRVWVHGFFVQLVMIHVHT